MMARLMLNYIRILNHIIDLAINCLQAWFQQTEYQIYSNLEQLLLKASQGQDYTTEFEHVCSFYKDDFQPDMLCIQL